MQIHLSLMLRLTRGKAGTSRGGTGNLSPHNPKSRDDKLLWDFFRLAGASLRCVPDSAIHYALAKRTCRPVAFLESGSQITPLWSQPTRLIALKSAPLGSSAQLLSRWAPRLDSLTLPPSFSLSPSVNDNSPASWHAKCNQIDCAPETPPWRLSGDLAENEEQEPGRWSKGEAGFWSEGCTIRRDGILLFPQCNDTHWSSSYQRVLMVDCFCADSPPVGSYSLPAPCEWLPMCVFFFPAPSEYGLRPWDGFCITMERRRDSRQASVKTHIHHRGGGCQISSMLNRWLASRCRGGRRGEIEVTLVWSPRVSSARWIWLFPVSWEGVCASVLCV